MANDKTIGRIQAQIQRRAAHCLQHEVADPRASLITITRVELTTDLTHAKIMYSVLGDDAVNSKTQHMLNHAAGFIQRRVASILRMRRIPRMDWVYDSSIADAARLDTLIKSTLVEDAAIRGEELPPPSPTAQVALEASETETEVEKEQGPNED
jgi:ribosome-binding factor A